MIVFIKVIKRKVNLIIRLIILVTLLIFFIAKLIEIISTDFSNWFGPDRPSGNPMRVEIEGGFDYKVVEYEK